MGVWQAVTMDSLKFHLGLPCAILQYPADRPSLKLRDSHFRDGSPTGLSSTPWTPHAVHLWLCEDKRTSSPSASLSEQLSEDWDITYESGENGVVSAIQCRICRKNGKEPKPIIMTDTIGGFQDQADDLLGYEY
jgi:hypothetical protein